MRELLKATGLCALALLLVLGYLLSYGLALRQCRSTGMPRWVANAYWPADVLIRHDLMPRYGGTPVDRYRAYLFGCAVEFKPRPPIVLHSEPNDGMEPTGPSRLGELESKRQRRLAPAAHP